ncbi:MAG: biotin synthase BioB [Chitinispirillaceae bacterium]|nr:biotin synthase BioB [Chitinispirillaceae bacterium]
MNLFETAARLYERSCAGQIDSGDLDTIIAWPNDDLPVLFGATDMVRRKFHGNRVDPCSLMNVKSGACSEDCAFCAQSSHSDTGVDVTKLADAAAIREKLAYAKSRNLPFCVVSSGRRLTPTQITSICDALNGEDGEKHASLGILDDDAFAQLRDAGVVCYNHNLEASRNFFPTIVSTHRREDRVATVKRAKAAGLKVCCGGIFGIGESWKDRKDFALELRALDVDTVPINFFNPVPGTRIAPPKETPLDFLKIVALFRLALPTKPVKVCGGRELHLGGLQALMFHAGANGYVSGGYLTTQGAGIDADDGMIASMGLVKKDLSHFE